MLYAKCIPICPIDINNGKYNLNYPSSGAGEKIYLKSCFESQLHNIIVFNYILIMVKINFYPTMLNYDCVFLSLMLLWLCFDLSN